MRLIPVSCIFLCIILGLGIGLFTPTPGAGIGVFLILAYGLFMQFIGNWQRGLSFHKIKRIIFQTASTSSMIYLILFGSEVLKTFFARTNLPSSLATLAQHSSIEPWTLLVLVLVCLIVFGFFMESLSMILIIVPFLLPVLIALNGGEYISSNEAVFHMDNESLKIWFGILALVIIEIGLITPPIGLNIFILSSLSKAPIREIFKGVVPFLFIDICRVCILLMFPAIILFLPLWFK